MPGSAACVRGLRDPLRAGSGLGVPEGEVCAALLSCFPRRRALAVALQTCLEGGVWQDGGPVPELCSCSRTLGGLRTAESAAPAAHSPESSGHGGCLSQAARAEGAPAARLGPRARQEGPPGPEESPLPCAGHRLLGAAVRRARYSLAPELALGAAQGAWQEGGLPVPSHPSRAVLLVRPGTGTCCFCSPRASLAPLRRWRRRPRWR